MAATSPQILTKIIATVGPACEDVKILTRLIEEGVRVFRINFSHGTLEDFAKKMQAVREASESMPGSIAILGDLSGPKIRVGKVCDGGIMLEPGDQVQFQRPPLIAGKDIPRNEIMHSKIVLSTTYRELVDEVQPGQRLLLDDGNVRLLCLEALGEGDDRRLICSVRVGGLITSSKGINLPDTHLTLPSLTPWDITCLEWAADQGIDFLALSFVRSASDIRELQERLEARRPKDAMKIPVIAKIEKPQALIHLDAIVNLADAVMVARGDLGVEMDLAKVPVMQKKIIACAHDYGKPVIVATQMLQSMIESSSPTRAEVSDVANAIYDGSDAVMLSGETAVGKYPIQTVAAMAHIALCVEENLTLDTEHRGKAPRKLQETRYRTAALAHGVSVVVQDLEAKLVATWSELGGSARYLSQNRLGIPIYAASANLPALRRMALLFGVHPVYMERPSCTDEFLYRMDQWIIERGWAKAGDSVVIVDGEPLGTAGVTNRLRIHYVGEVKSLRWPPQAFQTSG